MIRLPDIDVPGLAKPRPQPVSRYEPDAEWGGPASLGEDALLRDAALARGWSLVDADSAGHRFAAWAREEDARFDEAAAALQPAEAKGFAERTTRDAFERAKVFKAACRKACGPRSTTGSPATSDRPRHRCPFCRPFRPKGR